MADDKKKELEVTVIEVTEEYLKDRLYDIRKKSIVRCKLSRNIWVYK